MEIFKTKEEGHLHANEFCKLLELERIMYRYHLRHREVHGCDESDKIYERFSYLFDKPFINCRHLVLRERKGEDKRSFLLVFDASDGKVDVQALREIVDSKKLEFASDDYLLDTLHTYSGNVSVFHMCYDTEHKIEVIFDTKLLSDVYLSFHPLYNGDSIFLDFKSVQQYLEKLNHSYSVMDIPRKRENTLSLTKAV